jgi:ElaB/YqjD/DUF883 family membrane-anchored ribosome-binding protein
MQRQAERTTGYTGDGFSTEVGSLERELDRIKADLRQLRSDIADLGSDAVRAARTGVGEAARAAQERGRAAAEFAEGGIVSHPFLAVTSAFIAGALLGLKFGGMGTTGMRTGPKE